MINTKKKMKKKWNTVSNTRCIDTYLHTHTATNTSATGEIQHYDNNDNEGIQMHIYNIYLFLWIYKCMTKFSLYVGFVVHSSSPLWIECRWYTSKGRNIYTHIYLYVYIYIYRAEAEWIEIILALFWWILSFFRLLKLQKISKKTVKIAGNVGNLFIYGKNSDHHFSYLDRNSQREDVLALPHPKYILYYTYKFI